MTAISERPIILTAGGTGGHVFPAEALASELLGRGFPLLLVTDKRGESWGGTLSQLPVRPIAAGGIAGRNALARANAVAHLGLGFLQSLRLLRQIKPRAIVGFGGYASVPAMAAAGFLRVPSVLHEQNAVLGRANRLLAKRVTRIGLAFDKVRFASWPEKTILIGMPVRDAVIKQTNVAYTPPEGDQPIRVLALGGSQGATILSEVIPAAIAALPDALKKRLHIEQQCRPIDIDNVRRLYQEAGIDAELATFFADAPERLARAHLVIARSGASTVAELTAIGRPSILTPYPHAIDDHQTANARFIDEAGGGWLIPQPSFTAEALARRLEELFGQPEILAAAAARAKSIGVPDAARRLADLVIAVAKEKNGALS